MSNMFKEGQILHDGLSPADKELVRKAAGVPMDRAVPDTVAMRLIGNKYFGAFVLRRGCQAIGTQEQCLPCRELKLGTPMCQSLREIKGIEATSAEAQNIPAPAIVD